MTRIADMERRGDVITMGTLIDELERNTTIDIVKSALEFGCPVEVIIKILMHKLNLTKDEADQIYKTEVLGTATV